MVYVFDIDGTICTSTDSEYEKALPIASRIAKVNEIYDSGHTVIFQTARGMGRSDTQQRMLTKLFMSSLRSS